MVDLEDLKRAAQVKADERGKPVVQIPLDVWEAWLAGHEPSQPERIREALRQWDASAVELSDGWWSDFEVFLRENRLDLS
jgi:alpha-L-arabinofuranosidase